MEPILLVAVVLSTATNIFLIKQAKTFVSVTVPVPEVNVTVKAPERPEVHYPLEPVETTAWDLGKLEEILQQLVDLQKTQQLPFVIPNPTPMPQPVSPYWQQSVISRDTTNETEIDGVKGKKFPAR